MKKENLVEGKTYRHPDFKSDLFYVGDGVFQTYYGALKANDSTVAPLTEVREKIKVECEVWINVDSKGSIVEERLMDKTFRLDTCGDIYFSKHQANDNRYENYKPIRLKATFEEVDD